MGQRPRRGRAIGPAVCYNKATEPRPDRPDDPPSEAVPR